MTMTQLLFELIEDLLDRIFGKGQGAAQIAPPPVKENPFQMRSDLGEKNHGLITDRDVRSRDDSLTR